MGGIATHPFGKGEILGIGAGRENNCGAGIIFEDGDVVAGLDTED